MSDYEIDEIRRIRRQISAEHGHDLQRIAQHYRSLEKQLRESGRFKFADKQAREAQRVNTEGAI